MASTQPHATQSAGQRLGHILASPFTSAAASLGNVRRRLGVPAGTLWLSGLLLLGGIAAGVFISMQWQARSASALGASSPVTRQADRDIVAATVSRLEEDQAKLKERIANLRNELSQAQNTDARRKTSLLDINNEISRQRIASGMLALQGPGIVATFDDSTARSIPENEDPANYILHEYDLRDMLNTLWAAGAEAISINGERIVSNSSLYCVGTTIICNATRLSPPYVVSALGDPEALAAALQTSPQMEKFNQRAIIYDLPISIQQSSDVTIPAYNGSFVFKYATVQGQE
jgi:uncharacterized protein YlxW (UPF0749 family)